MNWNACLGNCCPIMSKKIFTSNSLSSGRGITSISKLSIRGSKFSIVVVICLSITDAVPKSQKSNRLERMSVPRFGLKNLSLGIVSTKFLTDLLIAFAFLRIVRSFVTGCGLNDKLISLNDLDILVFIQFSKQFARFIYTCNYNSLFILQTIKKSPYLVIFNLFNQVLFHFFVLLPFSRNNSLQIRVHHGHDRSQLDNKQLKP